MNAMAEQEKQDLARIVFYTSDHATVEALDAQARAERRSRSQMALILVEEALAARGGWPPASYKKGE